MRFQSRWRNTRYVLKGSKIKRDEYGNPDPQWGLVAKFVGPHRLFDSVEAQARFDWTDEQREFVERRLLGHKDFGRGLYLASGEVLPEEMQKYVKNQSALEARKRRCLHTWFEGTNLKQCNTMASVGMDFCDEHTKKSEPKIIKGMLTTKD